MEFIYWTNCPYHRSRSCSYRKDLHSNFEGAYSLTAISFGQCHRKKMVLILNAGRTSGMGKKNSSSAKPFSLNNNYKEQAHFGVFLSHLEASFVTLLPRLIYNIYNPFVLLYNCCWLSTQNDECFDDTRIHSSTISEAKPITQAFAHKS